MGQGAGRHSLFRTTILPTWSFTVWVSFATCVSVVLASVVDN